MTELAQAIVNGLQMGFLYALVAVGLTIIWGLMEMINFAHGEFLMLGMFGAWWLSVTFGLQNSAVAVFTSDYQYLSNTLLTRLSGSNLSILGINLGVPLLIGALLAL